MRVGDLPAILTRGAVTAARGHLSGSRGVFGLLHLKKLELIGFKSFPDRQELHFTGDGVAAIVGPNGCGKSNISDAISWVLGEQSAKTLRGARMQEFIFGGSRDRKPSGVAQASLTLVDPEGIKLPTPSSQKSLHANLNGATNGSTNGAGNGLSGAGSNSTHSPSEIVVTRKLFRSGESQYLLNGKACRLRDIQDIFLGTGLGPNHYAIIEQGRIEQILSSRPLDRRNFIEEAAGITRFKARKRLAELKLEGARQNLSRTNDIFQEITRQVGSLKRQASKARRYEELRDELRERLGTLIAGRHRALDAQLVGVVSQKEAAEQTWQQYTEKLRGSESEIARLRDECLEKDQSLHARREELTQFVLEIERLRARIEQQAKSAEDDQGRGQQAELELKRLNGRIEELLIELDNDEKELMEMLPKADLVRDKLDKKTVEVATIRNAVQESEETREKNHNEIIRLLGEASQGRNRVVQIDEFLAGNERQIARLVEEESVVREDVALFNTCSGEIAKRLETLNGSMQEITDRREKIEQALSTDQQERCELRQKTDASQEELSRLRARRESLEEILSHHAYTNQTIKNLFTTIGQQPIKGFKPVGILADYVAVDPAFEKATEEFLREELEYVVVHRWEEAREGIEVLRRDVQGRATFLVYPESPGTFEDPAIGPETGVNGRLADVVQLTNGLSGSVSALLPRLRRCYLVDDDILAQRLAIQHPDLYFLMPDGCCYRGDTVSGGKQDITGPLALKRELRELAPKVACVEQNVAETSQAIARLDRQIESNTDELKSVSETFAAVEKEALAADHEMQGVDKEKTRAQKRLAILAGELERLRTGNIKSTEERDQQQKTIKQLELTRQATEDELGKLLKTINEGRADSTRLAEEQVRMRTELAGLDVRRKSAEEALEKLRQAIEEHGKWRDETASQAEYRLAEADRLRADNDRCAIRVDVVAKKKQTLSEEVDSLRRSIAESTKRVATMEPALEVAREELNQERDRRSEVEIRLAEIRSELKHIEENCLRETGRPLTEVLSDKSDELTDQQLAKAEGEHLALREKLESMGAVNVLALEEHKEAKQRLEFLEAQQKDLRESIASTEKTITEIDTVSRSQFQEAFKAVNRNFGKVFQTLFGGGAAEMRLTDEEDFGESGIDIIASPPGKRLQNVALLSGGEKSLTAVALLMAAFRYRPSPFCVLDEVDAALDEPNLARFARLVREMSEHTQFILISHSRTTIEMAQTLYGVTMQQPGVSQLVSVRIAEQRHSDTEFVQTLA